MVNTFSEDSENIAQVPDSFSLQIVPRRLEILKKALLTLVVCILTFLLVEFCARWVIVLANPSEIGNDRFERKYIMANEIANKSKGVVFLGDSYMSYGIYTDLLQVRIEEAGIKIPPSYNLAFESGGYRQVLYFLENQLVNPKPKLIIVNVTPRRFNKNFARSRSNKSPRGNYFYRCVFEKPTSTIGEFECAVEKHSYFIRHLSFFKKELN